MSWKNWNRSSKRSENPRNHNQIPGGAHEFIHRNLESMGRKLFKPCLADALAIQPAHRLRFRAGFMAGPKNPRVHPLCVMAGGAGETAVAADAGVAHESGVVVVPWPAGNRECLCPKICCHLRLHCAASRFRSANVSRSRAGTEIGPRRRGVPWFHHGERGIAAVAGVSLAAGHAKGPWRNGESGMCRHARSSRNKRPVQVPGCD